MAPFHHTSPFVPGPLILHWSFWLLHHTFTSHQEPIINLGNALPVGRVFHKCPLGASLQFLIKLCFSHLYRWQLADLPLDDDFALANHHHRVPCVQDEGWRSSAAGDPPAGPLALHGPLPARPVNLVRRQIVPHVNFPFKMQTRFDRVNWIKIWIG